jgi:hypothetical protein
MGQSTDGILAYGYDIKRPGEGMQFRELDEDDVPRWLRDSDDEDADWLDFGDAAMQRLLAANGFTETWETRTGDGYHARESEAKAALGVDIVTHCSGEYPMYLLAAKSQEARRSYPEAADFTLPENGDERLAWALEVLGIKPEADKPQWLLASYWG